MGYKGALRSLGAAANRSSRESERRAKARFRAQLALNRKVSAHNEKLGKVYAALEEEYASGKLTRERYEQLKEKKGKISLELIIFAGPAGVALGKRYLTGKISDEEFDHVYQDIMPDGVERELDYVRKTLEELKAGIERFKSECKPLNGPNQCQHCGTQATFFKGVSEYAGLQLCGKCERELSNIQTFPELTGEYFTVAPCSVALGEAPSILIAQKYY